MDVHKLIGLAVLGLLAWTIVSSVLRPPSTIAGKQPIQTASTAFHWKWKEDTDGNGEVTLANRSTGERLGSYVAGPDGLWYESSEQARNGTLRAAYQPDLYLGQWNVDAGPFLGLGSIPARHPVQAGIRYSPCRLGFGLLAPDLVATEDAGGVGLSLFPPARAVGPTWAHFGLGVWYMAPWGGGRPGPVLGLSASIQP